MPIHRHVAVFLMEKSCVSQQALATDLENVIRVSFAYSRAGNR